MIRIDLHSHSNYSKDSRSTLDGIIQAVSRSNLHGIALTDHNELAGGLALKAIAPFPVIPGEEVMTQCGEIIGLFLKERIPPGLTPLETVERIREQDGIVYIPHPFDRIRGGRISKDQLDSIVEHVDLLEVFNARNALPGFNAAALDYAEKHGLAAGAGSDAHTYSEYGSAFVELPRFDDAAGFRHALACGRWRGRLSSPAVHLRTRIDVLRSKVSGDQAAGRTETPAA